MKTLAAEFLGTFMLVFAGTGAIVVNNASGAVISLAAMFGGPISGASMNPARSLGPALVSGQLGSLWVYLLAPVLGAALAVPACMCARENCCRNTLHES